MCCAGDEKLRCNTAVLFYFFPLLYLSSQCRIKIKTLTLSKFMMTLYNLVFFFFLQTLSEFSKGSVALMESICC